LPCWPLQDQCGAGISGTRSVVVRLLGEHRKGTRKKGPLSSGPQFGERREQS
jgi:hypothetical protein